MKQLKIKQQKLNGSRPGELCVMATGGGAYKFYDKIREVLGVDVLREDEMECLIIGKFKFRSLNVRETTLIPWDRARFLYHRNPPRSVHI
jgi:pantothenate kinase